MKEDQLLRKNLTQLIEGGQAHLGAKEILDNIDPKNRTKKPAEAEKSVWEELEHLRISQEDIIDYMLDRDYESRKWPDEYWPKENKVSDDEWNKSLNNFFEDKKKVVELLKDDKFDLFAKVNENDDHTNLREVLLIADHNAYHLSKIVMIRKMLSDW